jgi:hypothetical protein
VGDRGHRPVVLLDGAELDQLHRLERLDEVARPQVVGLAGVDGLLGPVQVGDVEGALEQVAPVVALAAIVGQALEGDSSGGKWPGIDSNAMRMPAASIERPS